MSRPAFRDVTKGGAQGARAPPVFLELLRRNIPCTCIWPDLYYIVHPQILALCNIPGFLIVTIQLSRKNQMPTECNPFQSQESSFVFQFQKAFNTYKISSILEIKFLHTLAGAEFLDMWA